MTYLAIIMAMTIVFSMVIFAIASNQFDRPLPQHEPLRGGLYSISGDGDVDIQNLLTQRADEAKLGLLFSLLILNIGMLAFGLWFSVHLARLTMEPIEQAMEEQSRFVSDASHELRTPLTALQSMNEVALRRKKITEKEARELAEANVEQATKLHALTSSLLGLVASNKVAVKLEPVAIQDAVADAMTAVVAAAQGKGITVDDETQAVTVRASREQLVHVLRILLDNAIKYSADGSSVRLITDVQGPKVRLSVVDKGIGITAADMPHIFSRFYRADTSRSKERHDGYGIGLAIAKSISDHMHWDITAESKAGKGSTFTVELPVAHKK